MADPNRKPDPAADLTDHSEDIGDVLSSIRRLIAQDNPPQDSEAPTDRLRQVAFIQARARAADASIPPPATAPRPSSPRLVLTRDERVAEGLGKPEAEPSSTFASTPPATLNEGAPQPQQSEDMIMFPASHQPDPSQSPAAAPLHFASQPPLDPTPSITGSPAPAAKIAAELEELNIFSEQQANLPADPPLHGLIRDVVIREMEGELGSRMTRNLRKLIRAEISLALQEATQAR